MFENVCQEERNGVKEAEMQVTAVENTMEDHNDQPDEIMMCTTPKAERIEIAKLDLNKTKSPTDVKNDFQILNSKSTICFLFLPFLCSQIYFFLFFLFCFFVNF